MWNEPRVADAHRPRHAWRRIRFWALVAGAALLAGCAKDPASPVPAGAFQPTDSLLLSTSSPSKDEDPSVVRGRDGRMYVAWFSERVQWAEIYVTSTADGRSWSTPAQVTVSNGGNYNPSLYQDDQGTFHIAWFRWESLFRGHIWYNSSPDGRTWNPSAEVQVTTTPDVDDWVPTLTQAADGTLLVYFVSDARDMVNPTNEIYVATKGPTDTSWNPAVAVADVNSPTEHDHLPFAARTGNQITLVWVRHDTSNPTPWLNAKSDLWYSQSPDGLSWAPPTRITQEVGNVVNLFPALYPNHAGAWSFVWLSTRLGTPRVFELPLASVAQYPQAVVENTLLGTGYSHRIAPTPTPGVYLGVWVHGSGNALDIWSRVFMR